MIGLVARIAISALGLWVATRIVPGVEVRNWETLVLAALLLGVVNAFVRPVLILVTLPFTLITLGLFILIINAGLFALVSAVLHGFVVHGFFAAFWGALVVSLVSWLASIFIGKRKRRGWRNTRGLSRA